MATVVEDVVQEVDVEENSDPKPRKKVLKRKPKEGKTTTSTRVAGRKPHAPYAVLRSHHTDEGPLTMDEAKELIGWTEEPEDEDWGTEYALKDFYNRKIRLTKNPTNRPLKMPIAKRYSSEFLRGKWKLNLETIVFGVSGDVRDGQHRLVGFILAEQERAINPKEWGTEPILMEVLLGFDVSDDKDTADSYDVGQARKLDDVIYRHETFGARVSDKDQRKISKTLAVGLRLVWLRAGGKVISHAPHFPHSEALEFYEGNKSILNSVKKIIKWDDGEGNERLISSLVSLGYAAGLHYLMAKVDKETADEFWSSFASGEGLKKGSPVLSLRSFLSKSQAGTGLQRDAIVGACIKAWLGFVDGTSMTAKEVQLKRKKEGDKFVFAESPRIGGMDVEKEAPPKANVKQQIILSVLAKQDDEITYEELSRKTGLSKGVLTKEIHSEENEDSLSAKKLVKVHQYEPEEGETSAPLYAVITASGRKQVGG